MIGDFENNWDEEKELVQRFENSIKSNLDLYFEEEELEDIIRIYFEQQKFKKAYKASKIALLRFPVSIEIKLLMAQSLIFNDELDEGLDLLENINNLSPNIEEIILALANAMFMSGNTKGAIVTLRSFLPMAEDKAEIYYSLGNFYRAEDNTPKAVESYKEAVKLKINHEDALFQLALITEEEGSFDEILEFYQQLDGKSVV